MPIPPAVIGFLTSPRKVGQALVAVGMIGGGTFGGITKAGEMIAGIEAQSDAQMQGLGTVLASVSMQYEAEIKALELELARTDIELAICEERGERHGRAENRSAQPVASGDGDPDARRGARDVGDERG